MSSWYAWVLKWRYLLNLRLQKRSIMFPSVGKTGCVGVQGGPWGLLYCVSMLLLLLLSHFSRVWLCATQWMAAHQAPTSLRFSRQEHWSGLPFPSPMHESEKWKWSRSVVSDSSRHHGLQPTRLLHPWDFPGKSTGVGCHCLRRSLKGFNGQLCPQVIFRLDAALKN